MDRQTDKQTDRRTDGRRLLRALYSNVVHKKYSVITQFTVVAVERIWTSARGCHLHPVWCASATIETRLDYTRTIYIYTYTNIGYTLNSHDWWTVYQVML